MEERSQDGMMTPSSLLEHSLQPHGLGHAHAAHAGHEALPGKESAFSHLVSSAVQTRANMQVAHQSMPGKATLPHTPPVMRPLTVEDFQNSRDRAGNAAGTALKPLAIRAYQKNMTQQPDDSRPLAADQKSRMAPLSREDVLRKNVAHSSRHTAPASTPEQRHQQLLKQARKLVSQTFYGTMLKQMRNSPFKSKIFDGGRGGEAFGGMYDQELAQRMTSRNDRLAAAIVRHIEKINPNATSLQEAMPPNNELNNVRVATH